MNVAGLAAPGRADKRAATIRHNSFRRRPEQMGTALVLTASHVFDAN